MKIRFFLMFLLAISVFACQNGPTYDQEERANTDLQTIEQPPTEQAIIQQYKDGDIRFFRESDDMVIAVLENMRKDPVVQTGTKRLSAKLEGQQRIYSDRNRPLYKVAYLENGFQLLSPDDVFLYQVTHTPREIKVAYDKEVTNFFEIKHQKDSGAQIRYRGSTLGNLVYMSDGHFISAYGERYYHKGQNFHPSYALLGLKSLDLEVRMLMIAELFQMGL